MLNYLRTSIPAAQSKNREVGTGDLRGGFWDPLIWIRASSAVHLLQLTPNDLLGTS